MSNINNTTPWYCSNLWGTNVLLRSTHTHATSKLCNHG